MAENDEQRQEKAPAGLGGETGTQDGVGCSDAHPCPDQDTTTEQVVRQSPDQVARQAIRRLLDGESPDEASADACGRWAEHCQALKDAYSVGGTDAVRTTFESLTKAEPALAELLASDPEEPANLPWVGLSDRPMREICEDAMKALEGANDPPYIFNRNRDLVRVVKDEAGRPRIEMLDKPAMRGRLARVANFVRMTESGPTPVVPPNYVVEDMLSWDHYAFPPLLGLVQVPVVREDGSILDMAGYDPATLLFYEPAPGLQMPAIPESPSKEDVAAAVALIEELLGDFPYADQPSRANAIGALITPRIRHVVGNVPLGVLDAPKQGTGKTLHARIIGLVSTGREPSIGTAPYNEEEWRKRITAILLEGHEIAIIDNLDRPLNSTSLNSVLTTNAWSDRILGLNKVVSLPPRTIWLATGNNVQLPGDMPRRCYLIRLDAGMSRAWLNREFQHPELIEWVQGNRGRLVAALLTVIRAWYAAGQPAPAVKVPILGGFETWCRTVGGILAFAGIEGFLGSLDAMYERDGNEDGQWEFFLEAWFRALGSEPITVAELTKRIRAATPDRDPQGVELAATLPEELAEVFTDMGAPAGRFARLLSHALRRHNGAVFGRVRLDEAGKDSHTGRARWRVTTTGEAS